MLETRKPAHSPRTRRLDSPPRAASRVSRPSSQPLPSAQPLPRSVGNVALGEAQSAPRPAARPPAQPRQSRLGRSEMRLMGIATTCTAVVCGLLLLYLAAYAHVTRLGLDQQSARAQLRESRLRNEMLRAERDRLQSPAHVVAAAVALGMTPRGSTPILYIAAPVRAGQPSYAEQSSNAERLDGSRDASVGSKGEQGTNGGTTADSNAAASFGH